jgi:L-fuconolactonase
MDPVSSFHERCHPSENMHATSRIHAWTPCALYIHNFDEHPAKSHIPVRQSCDPMNDRPSLVEQDVVLPELPVIDAHHHLWLRPGSRYLLDEFASDLTSGHRVQATVYVECDSMYRRTGPAAMQTVGEAEFVAGMAAMSDSGSFGPARVCAAYVGAADLTLGHGVDEVLDQLVLASGGRLRGIRGSAAWDADPAINIGGRPHAKQSLLLDAEFQAGVARLAARNLVYDAWQYFPQLSELCALADAVPNLIIAINHCGGLLGIGNYSNPDNFRHWKRQVTAVARRPNTVMKLGGLGRPRCGFGLESLGATPTASELAVLWQPYVATSIELFGPQRCMFGSNFPPDNVAGSYQTVWNALKLTARGCSATEQYALFSGTASRIYGIG